MKNQLTTWINVLGYAPFYFQDLVLKNMTKSKIWKAIEIAEAYIKASLKGYYKDFNTGSGVFYSINRSLNSNPDFMFDTDEIDVNTLETMVYKIQFSSSTGFAVQPDIGVQVSGTTTTSVNCGNITIKSAAWQSYTFKAGDLIYLGMTHYDSLITDLVSKFAAAKLIQDTFSSETSSSSNDAAQLENKVNATIKKLIDPINPQLLSVSRTSLNLDPIAIANDIDEYGNDAANYSDAEIGV